MIRVLMVLSNSAIIFSTALTKSVKLVKAKLMFSSNFLRLLHLGT